MTPSVSADWRIIFDGGSQGNPGRGYGSYRLQRAGEPWQEPVRLEFGDRVTNNEAEYRSLIEALRDLAGLVGDPAAVQVEVLGDSKLVLSQLAGKWKVKADNLRAPFSEAQKLARVFKAVRYTWHRRTESVASLATEQDGGTKPVAPFDQTPSGIPLHDVYRPADLGDLDEERDLGLPGEFPFTRGVHPSMYRGRRWTMRQYAGYASAEESNRRYRYLLAQGQTGLSVAFDLPTQIGYDPDHELARGEVGRVGVSIASRADMQRLFEGIPLEAVSTSMTINATAPVLLALYVSAGAAQGVPPAALRGTLQNDILKEYFARGTYIFPPEPSLRLVTDVIEYATREMPMWNPISVSGYHMREAGATAVQEIAFALADGLEYADAAANRGLDPDEFLPRMSFFFAAQSHLLEEVAKFRAARRLWARLVTERYQVRDLRSAALRFHTQTAGVTLTAQQPLNNVVRVAVQALAATLGGTQSLHTNAMDEALGLPTQQSATLALRTQQILAEEAGIADIVDPLAGSYAVETLTSELEARARALIDQILQMGGAARAVETGWVSARIAESAYTWQQAVETGERTVVGVNAYQEEVAGAPEVLRIDPQLEALRAVQIADLRSARDQSRASRALEELGTAAEGSGNLMPALLAAVDADSTLGEICGVLRTVFGEHRAGSGM